MFYNILVNLLILLYNIDMNKENYRTLSIDIDNPKDQDKLVMISKALSNKDRIKILNLLNEGPLSIMEISHKLKIPVSTTANHIQILDDARLIMTEYTPTLKGHMKLCSRMIVNYSVDIWKDKREKKVTKTTRIEMPIGNFVDANIYAPCGMAGEWSMLIEEDQPSFFYNPNRINAELLWFQKGYITYRFPLNKIKPTSIKEVSIELEVCSETAYYKEEWPSDITFSIGDYELFTYCSPGDFGKTRGLLNPSWWPDSNTQYGILKKFYITNNGVYIDDKRVNETFTIETLKKISNNFIDLKIEIKENSEHIGGINIFGKKFGNYAQGILLDITHE